MNKNETKVLHDIAQQAAIRYNEINLFIERCKYSIDGTTMAVKLAEAQGYRRELEHLMMIDGSLYIHFDTIKTVEWVNTENGVIQEEITLARCTMAIEEGGVILRAVEL